MSIKQKSLIDSLAAPLGCATLVLAVISFLVYAIITEVRRANKPVNSFVSQLKSQHIEDGWRWYVADAVQNYLLGREGKRDKSIWDYLILINGTSRSVENGALGPGKYPQFDIMEWEASATSIKGFSPMRKKVWEKLKWVKKMELISAARKLERREKDWEEIKDRLAKEFERGLREAESEMSKSEKLKMYLRRKKEEQIEDKKCDLCLKMLDNKLKPIRFRHVAINLRKHDLLIQYIGIAHIDLCDPLKDKDYISITVECLFYQDPDDFEWTYVQSFVDFGSNYDILQMKHELYEMEN
jgi:hypothetical protein